LDRGAGRAFALALPFVKGQWRVGENAVRLTGGWSPVNIGAWEQDMKIRIEKAACVGNARCNAVAGDLYPLDDDGYVAIDHIDVPAGKEALAKRGAKACPERIIFVIEDDE
jgi:ferredoxin